MKRTFDANGYYTDIPNYECKTEAFSRYLLDQEQERIYPVIDGTVSEPANKEYLHFFKVSIQIEVDDSDITLASAKAILSNSVKQIYTHLDRYDYAKRITEATTL